MSDAEYGLNGRLLPDSGHRLIDAQTFHRIKGDSRPKRILQGLVSLPPQSSGLEGTTY
jgi:hypothetical protein